MYATSHHTATRIAGPAGSTAILFAGGLTLAGGNAPLGGLSPAAPALTVARFSADGTLLGGARVAGPTSTIFHTVTPIGRFLGGASVQPAARRVTYQAATGYAWEAEPSLVTARWGHTTTIICSPGQRSERGDGRSRHCHDGLRQTRRMTGYAWNAAAPSDGRDAGDRATG